MQARSRETRRRLVRAALRLWSERGFETGIEETTAEEIAQAAGVTKGTFYFHFAHKEEILLEMGYETASILSEEAARCIKAGRGLEESLRMLMNALARSIKAADPAAVVRALAEFRRPRRPDTEVPAPGPAFAEAFEVLFERAQKEGEVTDQVEPAEMAQIIEALALDTVLEWATGRQSRLNVALHRRTAIVLAGLRPDSSLSL
ncbi:helix-turn-helix transcriptional regulator [Frankia sp. CNm7]|uniref:Helix-turn-helix transcriptional regulator n=2 Tax=Frankia nepalensis TaxID=1836974 RepID=A0A937RJM1_9ACTN|nr:TetR/AcrR family transcriptional regulator [Frankia nepalensis]MBL7502265.1 helix-turn-helix transcriptional regulator [Frankia nepalensis]MBL7515957.1 helix-turn-helix transcriptional regulator [Frankia nepalensis]MBL7522548.1 helix-turn-helix transcriptional regulator [Frankia nepalensis]MBL7627161.1 helix-turn-helix transcriptional regulator [Frankia nepalensis]